MSIKENLYLEHTVSIYEDKQIGIGVIIDKKGEDYIVLTCRHVLYSDNKFKEKLTINSENITKDMVVSKSGNDLALITIKKIKSRKPTSLKKKNYNDDLTISTFRKTDVIDDLVHANIDIQLTEETHISNKNENNPNDYRVYLIDANRELKHGYSGSPVFDKNHHQVIGVLNRKEDEEIGHVLAIENVKKLDSCLVIDDIKDDIDLEFEEVAYIFFEGSGDNYKIMINNKELFDSNDINIREKQSDIVDAINEYCNYVEDNENKIKRDIPISFIELVLPVELFCENIGQWKGSDSVVNLSSNYSITIRKIRSFVELSIIIEQKEKYRKQRWNDNIETKKLKDISYEVKDENFPIDHSKVSVHIRPSIEKVADFSFERVYDNFDIAIWHNGCEKSGKYQKFLKKILKEDLKTLPQSFRSLHIQYTDCFPNINLLWNNPNSKMKKHI